MEEINETKILEIKYKSVWKFENKFIKSLKSKLWN